MSSWGRLSAAPHKVVALSSVPQATQAIQLSKLGLPFGNGRSYGDSCLNRDGILWATGGLDHLIDFNRETGRLTAEAGVLLRDIQALVVPAGWMLPVTPGTQLITIGGAIANDIHGKNHYMHGSFSDHLVRVKLVRTDGETIECGPELNKPWFVATVGGIGLTGLIIEAEIQLKRVSGPWLKAETIPYENIGEFFNHSDESESGWEHTVSWIDCLAGSGGRGLFMRANPCKVDAGPAPKAKQTRIPFAPPVSLVNKLTLRPFNEAYYWLNRRKAGTPAIVHYQPFFYPLDNIKDWNKMYGSRGFYQYQSVVPRAVGQDATAEMLKEIGRSGQGSFLAVLKTFGNRESLGLLSFAQPGVTLALDFPNKGSQTLKLFERLDQIVSEAKGRIYLAKDARMPRSLFESGYPRFQEFLNYRDPGISSEMSRRLFGS
jgi:FAD/FMN-containing dehydrogenase